MPSSEAGGVVTTESVADLYLSFLLTMVESGEKITSMSITLSTAGGVISGDLISRDAWKSLWTETVLTKANAGAGSMGLFPDTVDRALEQARKDADGQSDSVQHGPRFMHLRDVTLFVPGASPATLPFWRGRLSSVTGWTLGKLGV